MKHISVRVDRNVLLIRPCDTTTRFSRNHCTGLFRSRCSRSRPGHRDRSFLRSKQIDLLIRLPKSIRVWASLEMRARLIWRFLIALERSVLLSGPPKVDGYSAQLAVAREG